ncbi:hypothetical protein FN846DRAFT_891465 [Sphaerosporella brunnea]|uniref:Uncharacterized protein n=1 Tax=Sphaerosporella brunnea TaxID=1250544 RepID=A0A5J5ESM9_9PEZI|nr:hypothetical protein FN846DRAFT_891465 [Sphaerosporella brunnea]
MAATQNVDPLCNPEFLARNLGVDLSLLFEREAPWTSQQELGVPIPCSQDNTRPLLPQQETRVALEDQIVLTSSSLVRIVPASDTSSLEKQKIASSEGSKLNLPQPAKEQLLQRQDYEEPLSLFDPLAQDDQVCHSQQFETQVEKAGRVPKPPCTSAYHRATGSWVGDARAEFRIWQKWELAYRKWWDTTHRYRGSNKRAEDSEDSEDLPSYATSKRARRNTNDAGCQTFIKSARSPRHKHQPFQQMSIHQGSGSIIIQQFQQYPSGIDPQLLEHHQPAVQEQLPCNYMPVIPSQPCDQTICPALLNRNPNGLLAPTPPQSESFGWMRPYPDQLME